MYGLAGIAERDVAICDGCIELCCDILQEETTAARAPSRSWTAPDDLSSALAQALGEHERPRLEEQLAAARARAAQHRRIDLQCSFCDRSQREVAKLIAGPKVFICDDCIGDAASLLLHRRAQR